MKVLMVWDSDYPWDIRVEKICTTILDAGWEMHLVCRNSKHWAREEVLDGVHIHRLPAIGNKVNVLNYCLGFPAFFSPFWLRAIFRAAKIYSVDIIIVRDLPLTLTAIVIGRLLGKPVILDMAECYPELVRLKWKYEPFKVTNLVVRNPWFTDIVERISIKALDHIFVMVEESGQRLLRKGADGNRITIVSNTPISERFIEAERSYPGAMSNHKGKLLLLYVGLVNFSRGLDTVLEGLRVLRTLFEDFCLVVLGTGNAESSLKKMTAQLSLEGHVAFEGWVDNKLVPQYVASSDICLVPHHKCGHWDHTIPNKLFDYMAAGKPVLVSNVKPMERIVNKTRCGIVFRDPDSEDFAIQLAGLRDHDLRKQLGKNGAHAILTHYNWDQDSKKLLKALKAMVPR